MKSRIYKVCFLVLIWLNGNSIQAQDFSKLQKDFLHKNAKEVFIDSTFENGNWESVLHEVVDKRIVLLGELNHGSKENFLLRNDLIKYLHEKAGFNVLLFEAGLGEAYVVNRDKDKYSGQIMTYNFMGQWQNKEFEGLMNYIKSENISFGGFDVQRGFGGFFNKLLEEECLGFQIDSIEYKNLESEFLRQKKILANRKTKIKDIDSACKILIQNYQNLKETAIVKYLNQESNLNHKAFIKTLENRIDFLGYMLEFVRDKNWSKRWEARDRFMADNVIWFLENVYRNQKVIIVGHNYHLSLFNEKEEVMGEFLKKNYSNQMYSIGFFIGSGVYAQNGERKIENPNTENLDIKHIIQNLKSNVNFLPIPENCSNGGEWLQNNIIVNDSFIDLSGSNSLVLEKSYDGLILIKESSLPSFNH